MSRPEQQLHRAVRQYLDAVLMGGTWWTTVAHGEGGGKIRAAQWKARGAKAGVPDIMLVHEGRVFFLELKAARGTLSPAQRECHFALAEAGVGVATCKSIDAVAECLALWRIPCRDAARRAA